jgi:hypothetical protein
MSKWRDTYKVHPSSDCFPIMSEDELEPLAAEDPADPRGASEDEGDKIIRHRAWDYICPMWSCPSKLEYGTRPLSKATDLEGGAPPAPVSR